MKKRLIGTVARAAVLTTAGGLVMTGAAQGASLRGDPPMVLTIRLHEIATNFTNVPSGALMGSKNKYGRGDYSTGDDKLENMAGLVVGRDEYVCTYANISESEEICPGHVSILTGAGGLPAGTLSVGTLLYSPLSGPGPTSVVPVLGGTGAYAGAKGTYSSKQITPRLLSATYHLTRM